MSDLSDEEKRLYDRLSEELRPHVFRTEALEKLRPETRLQEDLEMDSVRLVDLVLSLEDTYQMNISDEKMESLRTAGDVMRLIKDESSVGR